MNKTVLVTGSAKRIGRSIVVELGRQGYDVVIHYRSSREEAEELAEELEGTGVSTWLERADFEKEAELSGFIRRVEADVGTVNCLVNNASIFPGSDLSELTREQLERNIDVNAWAPFVLTRAFADRFDRGRVINILDTRIAGYDWNHVGYYFSKVLLARMTKMAAISFAPEFTVNAVAPGLITPPAGMDESYLEERTERVPLRTYGESGDVAEAVEFLLRADFITGQVIYVDGGRNLLHELEG